MKFLHTSSLLLNTIFSKKFIIQTDVHPDSMFNTLQSNDNLIIENVITIGDLFFTVVTSEKLPITLYNNENVMLIEEDGHVSSGYEQFPLLNNLNDVSQEKAYYLQTGPTWGLDRVDQRNNVLNSKYYYPVHGGKDVDVYVIDTGIDISHPELENRAIWGANYVDDKDTDCNGHGTHVAGTIGSKTYGIAKQVSLVAVKVLGCDGGGTFSGILAGFEFTIKRKQKTNKPSVVNMSLGGGKSTSINNAVAQMVKSGITVVVAAGNENQDACNVSPASAPEAITVGATSKINDFAGFSNFGKCVNILAPGVDILSTSPGGKSRTLSGTSMATPHTVGVVALILNENPTLVPNAVKKFLLQRCSKDVISGVKPETPNCMLYSIF